MERRQRREQRDVGREEERDDLDLAFRDPVHRHLHKPKQEGIKELI